MLRTGCKRELKYKLQVNVSSTLIQMNGCDESETSRDAKADVEESVEVHANNTRC